MKRSLRVTSSKEVTPKGIEDAGNTFDVIKVEIDEMLKKYYPEHNTSEQARRNAECAAAVVAEYFKIKCLKK